MSQPDLVDAIRAVPFWWHTLELAPGIRTPGQTPESAQAIRMAAIPADLSGKSVLDIGCWDGYFAFECEKRGAARVLAVDSGQQRDFVRDRYGIDLAVGQGFELAKRALASDVEYRQVDFFDIQGEQFDVVLFLGVLYHTKHPLLALEHLRALTRETVVIESHYVPDEAGEAYMRFYASDDLNQDPTNWWGPTIPCIERMCAVAGFDRPEVVQTYVDNDTRVIIRYAAG
jgi:tRNA (mo5U34)-methyltransferase